MPRECGLARLERVRRREEFERAYEKGSRIRVRFMTVFAVRTTESRSRLGVSATRKLGPAVARNRVKRLARELFRRYKAVPVFQTHPGLDIVVVPRREMLNASFADLEADYVTALQRIKPGAPPAGPPRSRRSRSGAA